MLCTETQYTVETLVYVSVLEELKQIPTLCRPSRGVLTMACVEIVGRSAC